MDTSRVNRNEIRQNRPKKETVDVLVIAAPLELRAGGNQPPVLWAAVQSSIPPPYPHTCTDKLMNSLLLGDRGGVCWLLCKAQKAGPTRVSSVGGRASISTLHSVASKV